jgi:mannosylglucosylglycerate synthase
MKTIAVLHYASPPIIGGVESTIFHHARLLTEAGFQVKVISGRGQQFHPKVAFQMIPEIDSRHPDTIQIGGQLAEGNAGGAFEDLAERLFLELLQALGNSDVLIVHNAVTLHKNLALTAALFRIAQEGSTPLVAWCHDFAWQDALYTPDLHPGYPWDLLKTAWEGVRYVAVSEHRRSRLAELLGLPEEQIRVITPGVDQESFLGIGANTRQLAGRLNLAQADPIGLLPARITRRKNIEFAVRVTAALKQHRPQVRLIVTGPPGPHNPKNAAYLEALKVLSEELDTREAVQFLYEYGENGKPLHLTDEEVADFFRLADFLFFPSLREGFGIPVLEAGLARLPIFAADIPPVRESAGDLAFLFDPKGDPSQVAQVILDKLEDDRAYRLSRRVKSRFTWEAVLKNDIIPIIQEAAG